ncbi:putative phage-related protein [Bordetella avium 197N]|uniref:Phage-related protein n=1 Tax=Bordetella avium (strain 197N) TaxID=360910 RepID=Q2KZ02_BORA1|nr:putative phage-related protein [Bordetella avium 197N]
MLLSTTQCKHAATQCTKLPPGGAFSFRPRPHRRPVPCSTHSIRHQHLILHPRLPGVIVGGILRRLGQLRARRRQLTVQRRHDSWHVQRR